MSVVWEEMSCVLDLYYYPYVPMSTQWRNLNLFLQIMSGEQQFY